MQLAVRSFLVLFGLVFVGLGYFFGVTMADQARAGATRAERLAPASAPTVEGAAPGAELLVEGALSARNQAHFRNFVAYVREEFRGADSNGDDKWEEDERITPPLTLEAGGLVQIANDDYTIAGPHERWQEEGLNWSSRTEEGTKRYMGLVAGRPAMAIGVVAPGREGNELRAELIYGGTRQEYIAGQRDMARFLPWVGLAVALVGAGVAFIGAWVLRRWR
ncbi:MAG: hypothetical protein HGA45_14750 [Chloroflexales bacterium]|nr:hypothetical protein [Chloroflexales bacterium]